MDLTKNWNFRAVGDSNWQQARVPGTVHTDLLVNKQIEPPYYRLNEHNLQWIDKKDWEYESTFELSQEDIEREQVALEFLGLDTYSEIYLNDSLLYQTDNMFRTYLVPCKHAIKLGSNTLRIFLKSPITMGIQKHDALPYTIPVSNNDLAKIGEVEGEKLVSIFTRKAGYHFGWDWGPRLVTSGIWRPIHLKAWDNFRITDVFIQQDSLIEKAHLSALIEVEALQAIEGAQLNIQIGETTVAQIEQGLNKGINQIKIPFEITNPKRWWPNGMGAQHLYQVKVQVTAGSHTDTKTERIGLRTIKLVTTPDSIGSAFYIEVNGHPVFMKGANYIPQDIFLPEVSKERYQHILQSAKDANMNMLRVWGGGIYEEDEFYELCDEMGLLVWQDFMFACAMFPGDDAFLENVRQEAIDNVKRLRNHTSIALWCGNNEILSAWENWGWKNKVIAEQSQETADIIWKAYDDIFHQVLPEVVQQYDATRPYWPSSPGSEFGKKESHDKGDAHYWMVWWGKKPFDDYKTAIPRFMSEYGFQSFPEFATVQQYTTPEDHDVYSEVMKSHQRSSIGNETIEEYLLRHYQSPKNFEQFLYVSHLLQAHGIKIGIEAHRRNRARCMGSLYWQINDCWPVASWSSIDYYGKWKALHYHAKQAFKNVLVSFDEQADSIQVHIVSDELKAKDAYLIMQFMDMEGKVLKKWRHLITIAPNQAEQHLSIAKSELAALGKPENTFLHATVQLPSSSAVLAENIHYQLPFKALKLPTPNLQIDVKEEGNHFNIHLRTDHLAKNIYLSTGSSFNFSDNYFDLLPQSKKLVRIQKEENETFDDFMGKLKVVTLVDSY